MTTEFPEADLWDLINDGWDGMSREQRHFWKAMRRLPELWALPGYGACWVVGLIGQTVLYYNHYEGGFERSGWTQYGTIDDFQSFGSALAEAIQIEIDAIREGSDDWTRSKWP